MLLEIREAPPFYKNGYVLGCEETREGVVIDPGDEIEQLLAVIRHHRLAIAYIFLTHAHIDHVTGVARAKQALEAPVVLDRNDIPLYDAVQQQGEWFGLDVQVPPPPDRFYEEGETIAFGRYEARVLQTPGHTPGGVSLLVGPAGRAGKQVFVGDTLFAGSIGRTDLPGGDYDTLIGSIRGVLFKLDDDVEVFSGHGPTTMIGEERRTNPFLTGRGR